MKHYHLVLILILILIGTRIATVLSQNTISDNLIAFVSEEDGNAEIYTIHSDGSNLRQLTDNSGYDNFPAWSPDGSQIVYLHEFELYIMNADGSDSKQLPNTFGARLPQWSPDSQWIVFVQERDIMLLNLQSLTIQNLTNTPDELELEAIWSFDGTSIIFTSNGDNPLPLATDGDPILGIYTMGLDGSNRVLIYRGGRGIGGISQNKDGQILYTGWLNLDPIIYQYDPATDEVMALTSLQASAYGAQFSADSSQIVLIYDGQLAIMDTDGQNIVQLTNTSSNKSSPAWQP
jgi:Tol biopolymer transport system component